MQLDLLLAPRKSESAERRRCIEILEELGRDWQGRGPVRGLVIDVLQEAVRRIGEGSPG